MGFTLNLSFGGLCLFVPETTDEKLTKVHVLMPDFPNHDPVLIYDVAATAGKPVTGKRKEPVQSLKNLQLDLKGLGYPEIQPPPTDVVDITTLFSAKVPKDLLTSATPSGVTTRVPISAGFSYVPACGMGGNWKFPSPKPVRLPIRVVWSVRMDAAFLEVSFTGLHGMQAPMDFKLFPHLDALDLWIFNSPLGQHPKILPPRNVRVNAQPDKPADHFKAFYSLTNKPTLTDVPLFVDQGSTPGGCFPSFGNPGLDLFCIGAQAELLP